MADKSQSAQDWTRAWLDAQQHYMDAWMKMTRQETPWQGAASPFAAVAGNPWANSFEQWSRLFGQGMPKSNQEVTGRLFDLARSYQQMSESFWSLLNNHKQDTLCSTDWQDALKKSFETIGKSFNFPAGATDPWSGFANLWGLPLGNWQRMACSLSPFPGEMEKALRMEQAPLGADIMRPQGTRQPPPPIGYTREWQEMSQEWMRLSMEYVHAMQEFGTLLGTVVQCALDLFGNRMTEKVRAGESFDGLRAIYDLWIDCGEEAYAEQVANPEFAHLQAELVNALMRMKRHEQLMVTEFMTALNIPTRQEMDTTHKRVYELQRQLRELQDVIEDAAEAEVTPAPRATPKPRKAAPRSAARAAPKKKTTGTTKRRTRPNTRKG